MTLKDKLEVNDFFLDKGNKRYNRRAKHVNTPEYRGIIYILKRQNTDEPVNDILLTEDKFTELVTIGRLVCDGFAEGKQFKCTQVKVA